MAEEEDEEYELISRQDIIQIRKELDALKQDVAKIPISDLMKSIQTLSEDIKDIHDLFVKAAESMEAEKPVDLGTIMQKLDAIEDQNKKVAQGILAVVDMMEEIKRQAPRPAAAMPVRTPFPPVMPMTAPRPEFGEIRPEAPRPSPMMAPGMMAPYGMPGMKPAPLPPLPKLDLGEDERGKKKFLGLFGK